MASVISATWENDGLPQPPSRRKPGPTGPVTEQLQVGPGFRRGCENGICQQRRSDRQAIEILNCIFGQMG